MSQLFLFLRRKKEKPSVESNDVEESIPEVEVPEGPQEQREVEENDIEILLTRARYPIRDRIDLLKALGGSKAEVSVGTKVYIAGEIADRCFSGRTLLNSTHEVIEALNETPWIKVVMGKLNMLPFPVDSKEQFVGRLRDTYVDGVPALDLIDGLEFPVKSPSDLLAQLAKPRSIRATPDKLPTEADTQEEGDQNIETTGEEEPSMDNPVQIVGETPA
jgi:hypothetical protein